jgi:hypothetical protein
MNEIRIRDIIICNASVQRASTLPVGADLNLEIQCGPDDSQAGAVLVQAMVKSNSDDSFSEVTLSADCLVLTDSEGPLPDEIVRGSIQMAWPYLKATLDVLAGVGRIPPLPVSLLNFE